MKNKLLAVASALLLLSSIRLGALQGSNSGGGGDKNPPAQANAQTGDQSQKTDKSAPAKPSIVDVVPAAPAISCNAQKLTGITFASHSGKIVVMHE